MKDVCSHISWTCNKVGGPVSQLISAGHVIIIIIIGVLITRT